MKILLVEDDNQIAKNIIFFLKRNGYLVTHKEKGAEALKLISNEYIDAIILDWMLPDIEGIDIAKTIRNENKTTPIIMLTAKTTLDSKLEGLNAQIDDYITKPFIMQELLARLKNALRRSSNGPLKNEEYILQDITINTTSKTVVKDQEEIQLSPKLYDMLEHFALNKDRVITRDELLERIWGEDTLTDSNKVDVHIKYLRDIIDPNKKIIKTVKQKGYIACSK